MRKAAVWACTRNLYDVMVASAKSLMRNVAMDAVYFLTEDDELPPELAEGMPDTVHVINVSEQPWFDPDGPNYKCHWTHMSLMRLALPWILPEEERILYLDVDTITFFPCPELWDIDLEGKALGMVREPGRCRDPFVYYNAGVMLIDQARFGEVCGDLINTVNHRRLTFPDQDAINLRCQELIHELPPTYNSCMCTGQPMYSRIVHYAAERDYRYERPFQEHLKMKWSDLHAR